MVSTVAATVKPTRTIRYAGIDNGTDGSAYCSTGTGSGDDGFGNLIGSSTNGNLGTFGVNPTPEKGAWITNTTAGYYMGEACDGWKVSVSKISGNGWIFGSIKRSDNSTFDGSRDGCGWLPPGTVAADTPIVTNGCDDTDQARLADRTSYGADYNCLDEAQPSGANDWCDGGTSFLKPVSGCDSSFYLNYNVATQTFRDKVGTLSPIEGMGYRYTTKDGRAAIVQTNRLDWGYIAVACIPPAHKGVISTGGTDPNNGAYGSAGKPHPGYFSYNVNCGKAPWVSDQNKAVADPNKPNYYNCP